MAFITPRLGHKLSCLKRMLNYFSSALRLKINMMITAVRNDHDLGV